MIRILCFVISEMVDDESYLVGTVRLLILLGLCSPLDCKLLTKLLELCLLLLLGKGFDLVSCTYVSSAGTKGAKGLPPR